MPDDSLDDMPEFGKEDRIPIVIPDHSGPVEFDPEVSLPGHIAAHHCKGVEYDGKPCPNWISHDREFCRRHDPTPDEMMQLLMERLESYVNNCRNCGHATPEEVLTIAAASKAFIGLYEHRKVNDKSASKQIKVLEYKLVEPDARATG